MYSDDLINEMYRRGAEMGKNIDVLLQAKPFRPFTIHMNGKWTHEVTDPKQVEVRGSVAEIRANGQVRSIIALMHVISLTVALPAEDEPVIVEREKARKE